MTSKSARGRRAGRPFFQIKVWKMRCRGDNMASRSAGFALFPGRDEGFQVDAEAVGDAVDVVEVGDGLHRVVDGAVVEAVRAQGLDVRLGDAGGRAGEFLRQFAQGAVCRAEGGGAPVGGDKSDEAVGFFLIGNAEIPGDLGTEVVGVRARSVDAVVGGGDDGGDHFPLAAGEGGIAVHDREVEVHGFL